MGCAPSMPSGSMLRPLKQRFVKDNKSDVQLQQQEQQQEQQQQSEYLIETISDHKGGINCMEISEDRSLLITGGEDATIRLWATMSSPIECLSILYGHTSYITCCGIFNCHIISGSADKSIRLWSIDSSDCIAILKGHQAVINHLVFHERFIFSVSFDKTCRVWDIESNIQFTKNTLHQIDSDELIDDEDDQVIDASKCCIRVLTGHTKSVTQVIYIPNEHIKRPHSAIIHETDIIVTASADSTIRTWSLETGECLKVLSGHNGPVNCVVVDSVNRRQIYTGGADGVIRCWDTITGELVRELAGHDNTVLVLMGYNKILYSGSLDRTAKAWVMEFGECTRTFWRNQGGVNCIKYFDGNLYTGSSDTTARIYDAKSGVIKRTFEGHLNGISALQIVSGKLFTGSFDGKLCVWNCDNLNEDTVFGIVSAESEEDLQEDSENIRRAIKALDPYIRNFR